MEQYIGSKKELWIVSYDALLRKFQAGLSDQVFFQLEIDRRESDENIVDDALEILKKKKDAYPELYKCLSRVRTETKEKKNKRERIARLEKIISER